MAVHPNNDSIIHAVSTAARSQTTATVDDYEMLNIIVSTDDIISVVKELKENQGFIFLTDLCAAHYPERENTEFEVVYHLHNLITNHRVRLRVQLSEQNVSLPTLVDLYPGANWMERETFDFYGVNFEGHPNLKRILNMDDMDYHPLRKQYALEDETRDDKNNTFFGR